MQMQTVQFYLKNVTKEHWGFDDPAGKDWSEFQRVRDEIKAAIETFAHRV